jgi:hypothetical protein
MHALDYLMSLTLDMLPRSTRFSAHLVPCGLLFLVLPRRWICACPCPSAQAHAENASRTTDALADSDKERTQLTHKTTGAQKSIDVSFAAFELLLHTIGFKEVAERRVTPKLVFFTLEKAPAQLRGPSVDSSTEGTRSASAAP